MRKIVYLFIVAILAVFATHAQSCDNQDSNAAADSASTSQELKEMRLQIDSLDDHLIEVLAARMKVCLAVGEYKKQHNIAVVQSNRYNEIVERLCKEGKEAGLDEDFVKKIMDCIHEESVRQQQELIDK